MNTTDVIENKAQPLEPVKKQTMLDRFWVLVFMFFASPVFAASKDSPFDKFVKIIDVVTTALTGKVAAGVFGLAIIICGFMALKGRIPWGAFWVVLVAILTVTGASWLAQLLMTGEG